MSTAPETTDTHPDATGTDARATRDSTHGTAGPHDVTPTTYRPRVPRWAFLPFIIVAVTHVIALALDAAWLAAPTKLALMPLLAFAVLVGARGLRSTGPIALLITAILLSWLGDGAGTFMPFLPTLPMMLLFFGLAHVAYILVMWRHGSVRPVTWRSLVFIAWWGGMLWLVGPHAGDLLVPLAIYGALLALTATAALRCVPAVAIGGLFFLTSDSLLAVMLFVPGTSSPWLDAGVMATYTLGQGLIAAGLLATFRRRARIEG